MRRLSPSLREKKRYLAFEIISKTKVSFKELSEAVWASVNEFMGTQGAAKAGIWILSDKWNPKTQKGLMKVSAKSVNQLRIALALVTKAGRKKIIIRSIGLSGILNKAERYLADNELITDTNSSNYLKIDIKNKGDMNG